MKTFHEIKNGGNRPFFRVKCIKRSNVAILKRHCYHSNGNDVIFVNNFHILQDCSIYVEQVLSSNKKPLFKKFIKSKSRFCHISKL
jgi:hypothetical protein